MVIHLIKKDILIIKKCIPLILGCGIGIPLFFVWRLPELSSILGFIIAVIFSEYFLFQNLLMKETQYSKATVLLCSTPYPRWGVVMSKYILFMMVFGYCVFAYWIDYMCIPQMKTYELKYILIVYLVVSIMIGVYLPVQYLLGYNYTKYFLWIIPMISPFILPMTMTSGNVNISNILLRTPFFIEMLLFILGTMVLFVSMVVSVSIFKKKELI